MNANDPLEAVNFRLTARGRLYREPEKPPLPDGAEAPKPRGFRQVYFDAEKASECALYLRSDLQPGQTFSGPAIVDQLDSTTPLYPGDRARIDGAGNLIIEIDHDN